MFQLYVANFSSESYPRITATKSFAFGGQSKAFDAHMNRKTKLQKEQFPTC